MSSPTSPQSMGSVNGSRGFGSKNTPMYHRPIRPPTTTRKGTIAGYSSNGRDRASTGGPNGLRGPPGSREEDDFEARSPPAMRSVTSVSSGGGGGKGNEESRGQPKSPRSQSRSHRKSYESQQAQRKAQWLDLSTKYAILGVISSVSSFAALVLIGLTGTGLWGAVDAIVSAIALSMMGSVYDHLYHRVCWISIHLVYGCINWYRSYKYRLTLKKSNSNPGSSISSNPTGGGDRGGGGPRKSAPPIELKIHDSSKKKSVHFSSKIHDESVHTMGTVGTTGPEPIEIDQSGGQIDRDDLRRNSLDSGQRTELEAPDDDEDEDDDDGVAHGVEPSAKSPSLSPSQRSDDDGVHPPE